MAETSRSLKVYLAGELFDFKHLGGNFLLAESIEKHSSGRYRVMLPQNGECEVLNRSAEKIRDADFKLLFECDLILANLDGTDPDSGTVVEFCFAKMVDMPAVLLRSDFRNCGDQDLAGSDPWNLMCSCYPRTQSCVINAMELYHQCRSTDDDTAGSLERFIGSIADQVIDALDAAVSCSSWLKPDRAAEHYRSTVKSIGGTLGDILTDAVISDRVNSKSAAGIYR